MSKKYPQLYAKASNGKIKTWIIEAKDDIMIMKNGYIDGTIKEQTKKIVGKNIGRSNETTPEQQCELECESKWKKKIDEQYVESLDQVGDYADNEIILPMLAHSFEKRKHNIKYPCYVQPKLNGVRCIYQNGKFISRKGKEFTTLDHLVPELKKLKIDMPDGEIYVHGMSFQQIIRLVKKFRSEEENGQLEYWTYDHVNNRTFEQRHSELRMKYATWRFNKIREVETVLVDSEEEIKKYHDKWVKEGFEGIIIRNADGKYAIKHRSADLQKYKQFMDEEYEIVGGKPGTGSMEGCCVFEVKCGDSTFNVMPRGNVEVRRKYLKDIDKLKGKMLTVRYQEKSESGIPVFPVGICIRDYE